MKAREFRVCQLAGCDVWRVEVLQHPRPWVFWLKPRWRPVIVCSLFDVLGEGHAAEYGDQMKAIAAMERFQRRDKERIARVANHWDCGVAS